MTQILLNDDYMPVHLYAMLTAGFKMEAKSILSMGSAHLAELVELSKTYASITEQLAISQAADSDILEPSKKKKPICACLS